MANVMLTRGGEYRYNFNSLSKQTAYDKEPNTPPCRIAGEYHHGFFTPGNSFNPQFAIGQAESLDLANVGVGDFIGLAIIPEHHTLIDVAAHTVPHQPERGYPGTANAAGLTFEYEVRKYSKETLKETGKVDLVSDMTGLVASEAIFKRSAIKPTEGGYFVPTGEFLILGLKVTSMPTDTNVKLADVTCRVEVTGHAYDYEAPIHI